MKTPRRFDYGALSHEGRVRINNEDAFGTWPAAGLAAVADGMGGHENGEWASAAIIEELAAADLPHTFDEACRALGNVVQAANTRVFAESQRRGVQMGSTVVLLLVRAGRFAVLWVGDSRAYLVRGGAGVQLSRDHTQVQELIDRGLLAQGEAHDHPMRHVLARAVGVAAAVQVDMVVGDAAEGDAFLLCSDGLTARVGDEEIVAALGGNDVDAAVRQLVDLTLARGAPDNVTVVTVAAERPTVLILNQPLQTVAP